jgi:hypothetical protein
MNARVRRLEGELEKLERTLRPDGSFVVWASCVIPDNDEPVTSEIVDRWLQDGTASRCIPPHVIHYHGGTGKLSADEWMAKYGPGRIEA